eukprot:8311783-Pyramimonas_sp.AAC.1
MLTLELDFVTRGKGKSEEKFLSITVGTSWQLISPWVCFVGCCTEPDRCGYVEQGDGEAFLLSGASLAFGVTRSIITDDTLGFTVARFQQACKISKAGKNPCATNRRDGKINKCACPSRLRHAIISVMHWSKAFMTLQHRTWAFGAHAGVHRGTEGHLRVPRDELHVQRELGGGRGAVGDGSGA